MDNTAPRMLTQAKRALADPPDRVAMDAGRVRPARTTAESETRDLDSYLSVYFLGGTLLVFFLTGGFWIWHFAR
jgi:hypothetical protein